MSEVNLMKQKEGEEQKEVDDKLQAAQQSIDSNNMFHSLEESMLKDQTDKTNIMISIIKEEPDVKSEEYCEEDENANLHNPAEENLEECKKIKIELEYPDISKCKEEEQIVDNLKIIVKEEPADIAVIGEEQRKLHKGYFNGWHNCNQCNYIGAELQDLKQHELSRHNIGGHPCNQCDYVGTEMQHLKQHKLNKHGFEGHPCNECKYVGANLQNLKLHKLRKHCFGGYSCDECEYVGAELQDLKQHKRHKNGIRIEHLCVQCDYKCTGKKQLIQHKLTIHSIGGHPCCLCNFKGAWEEQLKLHMQNYHGLHECNQCDNYFGSKLQDLKQHKLSKHSNGGHPCNQCEYVGTEINHLEQHKLTKHGIGGRPCDQYQCEYKGTGKKQISQHKFTEHGIGGCPCTLCEFTGACEEHLMLHKLNFHGWHNCNQCNYFGAKLKQHQLNKHGIGGHACDQCEYVGPELQHLEQHKSLHKRKSNKRKYMGQTESPY